jgi:hypothetical protein
MPITKHMRLKRSGNVLWVDIDLISTDGGAAFALLDSTSFAGPAQAFPHLTNANIIYLETLNIGPTLYRYTDGGRTFSQVSRELPIGTEGLDPIRFAPTSNLRDRK